MVDRTKERRELVQLVKWRVPNAVLMWVKVIAKKKWQRNIQHYAHKWAKHYMRRETALILDGSLKGNSKLREVRHPAPEEREKFIAQSSGRPPRWQWIRNCAPKLLIRTRYCYLGRRSKGIVARLSTSKRKYWAQADTNNLLLNAVNYSWNATITIREILSR